MAAIAQQVLKEKKVFMKLRQRATNKDDDLLKHKKRRNYEDFPQ
jgi:hypothetical protein